MTEVGRPDQPSHCPTKVECPKGIRTRVLRHQIAYHSDEQNTLTTRLSASLKKKVTAKRSFVIAQLGRRIDKNETNWKH